jgi:hypothetical protein
MDGENDPQQPEEFFFGIIRGEHVYVPEEGADQEGTGVATGEGSGREGAGEDEGKEDVL